MIVPMLSKGIIEHQIKDSFRALLADNPYSKISVNDITGHAHIARQTFYTYFQSKDELVLSFLDEVFNHFFHDFHDLNVDFSAIELINKKIFRIWFDEADEIRMVLSTGLDDKIYKRFRRYVARGLGNIVRRNGLQVNDDKLLDYYVDYVSGSSFHLMKHWLEDDMPYSPDEMSQTYMFFLNPEVLSKFMSPSVESVVEKEVSITE